MAQRSPAKCARLPERHGTAARAGPAAGGAHGGPELLTFGHGTAGRERLAAVLRGAEVAAVVDVRTAPGSRRNPDAERESLGRWLPEAGIAYRWEKRLGGFRRAAPESPDTVWRNASFRGYAGYTRHPEFRTAMAELVEQSRRERTAVMCGETLWWRCHRRIIADAAVLLWQVPVLHLLPDGRLAAHRPTPGVRVGSDRLLYYDDLAAAAGG